MRYIVLAVLLSLASCGPKATTLEDFHTRPVTLPGGQVIHVETMISDFEMLRGLMFRTSLAPDRGMLFVHPKPEHYKYWMYQTLIPLDIVWLDSNRDIVEMVADAQPCKTQASKCAQYGGKQISSFVLEIPGGMARKFGLQLGQRIQF
ncbi:MAG TPA: DUF192 domain-containing protein [Bryobacteraceae bacterium]|jgi:uncharacterized membrane protein (UPF0127 family)|nr:DUF192 domain-containing protein [Bryobacteraceae bacterium]